MLPSSLPNIFFINQLFSVPCSDKESFGAFQLQARAFLHDFNLAYYLNQIVLE